MVEEVRGKLAERIKRTPTVESFRFISQNNIKFLPGQFLQLIFDEEDRENRELNKYLSFSSSPAEDYREVTKRLSESKFSQRLESLKIGDEVLIKGPLGSRVFKDNYQEIAFLIGGIGITPVISIIGYIVESKLDTDILLLYSNRTEEEIAFKKELGCFQSIKPKIKVIYTVTECPPKDKNCLADFINRDLLIKKAPDLKERIVFVFGPPGMVKEMVKICFEVGCRKESIRAESFLGYEN